jgi:hypothetical protein
MKPTEYLKENLIKTDVEMGEEYNWVTAMTGLDKRFIDREELKKYINKRMLEYDTLEINGEMTPFEKMRCINELLLILELVAD